MNHPEHDLQVKINQTQREVILCSHLFFGIDRSRKTGRFTHVREKARGLVKGTSDTILLCPNFPAFVIELKAKGKTPDDDQIAFGVEVSAAGHLWHWADTVTRYFAFLDKWGVPLAPNWRIVCEHRDVLLASSAIRREEAKTGKPSKKRSAPRERASAGRIRKAEALRGRVPF